jgi:hypothetical protein
VVKITKGAEPVFTFNKRVPEAIAKLPLIKAK